MHKVFKFDGLLAAGAAAAMMLSGCYADQDLALGETDEALAGPKAGDLIPGKYIVVLKDDGQAAAADYGTAQAQARGRATEVLSRHGIAASVVEHVYGSTVRGFSATLSQAELKRLSADPSVSHIEQDSIVTLLAPSHQGEVVIQAQTVPPGITRVGGGATYTGSNRAWVIDTGIDLDHPDLNVDVARSRTFVSTSRSPDDGNGHGTHVAGTIAAKNDANRVIFNSYYPGWCDGLFNRFGLLPFLDRSPYALSEGQKKRVSFAAALSVKPELIVLDEPTPGQDEPFRRELTSYLHQLQEEGQTIIFVTHDLEFAAEHADRWLILSDGKIIADGSPDAVMEEATTMSKAGLRPTQQFQLIQAIKRLEENKT